MASFLNILKDLQQRENQSPQHQSTPSQEEQNLAHSLYTSSQQEQEQIIEHRYFDQSSSYIQYIPFKRKVIDFQERVYRRTIPRRRIQGFDMDRVILQTVPKLVTKIDYFAVERLRYYEKQIIPQKSIEYVPVLRTRKKIQYIPVQRKIVHYPRDIVEQFTKELTSKNPFLTPRVVGKQIHKQEKLKNSSEQFEQNFKQLPTFSPTKYRQKLEFRQQNRDEEERYQSVLVSLNKAYSNQKSTRYGQEKATPISQICQLPAKSPGLHNLNPKSAETVYCTNI